MSSWIDIIIALDVPLWALRPWPPWVIMTTNVEHIKANLVIEGDFFEYQSGLRENSWL